MYYTICKCPVCGQELDTLSHPAPEPSGQATAMLIQPLRREHAEQSPACTQDERWYQGWTKETFPGPLSERNTPSEP